MTMQWNEENNKDIEMLKRIEVSPLDTDPAKDNEQLFKQVQRHNKSLADLTERFEKLARDREELSLADHWFAHDSKAVLAERRRVLAESWDVLVTLRELVQERRDLLDQVHTHVAGKVSALEKQYSQAFDTAVKTISWENRSYLKAEPVRAQAWVEAEADSDDAVVALREQIEPLRETLDRLATLYHRVGRGNALTFRQREVYEQLN